VLCEDLPELELFRVGAVHGEGDHYCGGGDDECACAIQAGEEAAGY